MVSYMAKNDSLVSHLSTYGSKPYRYLETLAIISVMHITGFNIGFIDVGKPGSNVSYPEVYLQHSMPTYIPW